MFRLHILKSRDMSVPRSSQLPLTQLPPYDSFFCGSTGSRNTPLAWVYNNNQNKIFLFFFLKFLLKMIQLCNGGDAWEGGMSLVEDTTALQDTVNNGFQI